MSEYMTDEELLQFINDVEQHDIVEAPPGLCEKVIGNINNKNRLIEYKKFRNRVIVSVAALLIITINAPYLTSFISENLLKISYNENILSDEKEEDFKTDSTQTQMFEELGQSYYISNLLHRKEE